MALALLIFVRSPASNGCQPSQARACNSAFPASLSNPCSLFCCQFPRSALLQCKPCARSLRYSQRSTGRPREPAWRGSRQPVDPARQRSGRGWIQPDQPLRILCLPVGEWALSQWEGSQELGRRSRAGRPGRDVACLPAGAYFRILLEEVGSQSSLYGVRKHFQKVESKHLLSLSVLRSPKAGPVPRPRRPSA